MDAFLTDETSCALLRVARYMALPRMSECAARAVSVNPSAQTQWWRPAARFVGQFIPVDEKHPLCVSVPDHRSRVQSSQVRSVICSTVLPKGSYLSLEMGNDADPDDVFIAIESPAHSFASLARVLDQAERAGRLTHLQARALLLAYGYELCGSYARDPTRPLTADCHYRLEPSATPDDLTTWCRARTGRSARGIRLARECAPQVMAGSASPAETIHGIVLISPPELGGLGMSDAAMNHTLELTPEERALVHRLPLTPDLTFPQFGGLVLEHQGGTHDDPLQYREDASRTQDYWTLGRPVIMTSSVDFESPEAYDAFLHRLIAGVRRHLGAEVSEPYQAILDDPRATAARHELLSVLTDRVHDPWHW